MRGNKALQASGLLKRKRHSIALGVRSWLSFKAALERGAFGCSVGECETLKGFSQHYRHLVKVYGPRAARRNSATGKRLCSDIIRVWFYFYQVLCSSQSPFKVQRTGDGRGFGVFATCNVDYHKVRKTLLGFIARVDAEEFQLLQKHGYPSLLGSSYILLGPLSFVNHDCGSDIRFSNHCRHSVDEMQGFPAIRLKQMLQQNQHWAAGEEIVVKYGYTLENCQCHSCEKKKLPTRVIPASLYCAH